MSSPSLRNNTALAYSGFAVIFLFFCYTYFEKALFLPPMFIHSWAQADRLALAISFYDNGMNFFKPATLAQFSKEGVVGVEFPIQAYIAAAIAKLAGREHISVIFKPLDCFLTGLGLSFLFLTVYKRSKNFVLSLAVPVFIFCSPVFIYYTCSYLPDPAAVSLAFVGFYFIANYFEQKKTRDLFYAALWLTIGTMMKMSLITYLAGFFGVVFIEKIRARDFALSGKNIRTALIVVLSCAMIVANYLQIQHLNKAYDSDLFLSTTHPFKNWDAFNSYIESGFKTLWLREYFELPQYLFLAALAAPGVYLIKKLPWQYGLLLIFYFVFAAIIFWLMGENLPVHDYYFIAIWMPFFGFLLLESVLALNSVLGTSLAVRLLNVALVASMLIMFFFADFHTYRRFSDYYPPHSEFYRTAWMENGKKVVDRLIPKSEQIVVLEEDAPNLSLVYFDRKGHVLSEGRWWHSKGYLVDYMRDHDLQYLVVDKGKRDMLLGKDSLTFASFQKLTDDEQVQVYRLHTKP